MKTMTSAALLDTLRYAAANGGSLWSCDVLATAVSAKRVNVLVSLGLLAYVANEYQVTAAGWTEINDNA